MINKVSVLFGVFLAFSAIFFGIYLARVKDARQKKSKLLLYLIVTGILIGLTGTMGIVEFAKLPLWIFIAAQLWVLAIGILHAVFFEKIIPLENNNAGIVLFTIAGCLFGYALVFLSFMLFLKDPFPRVYLAPAFLFIIPVLIVIAFNHFIAIPSKVYREWEFPAPGTLSDPSDSEMAEPVIVNFVIKKKCTDSSTVFKVKAPSGMMLGKLYYFFVMDYNSRYPDNPVILNNENKAFKWLFCLKPGFAGRKKHLDPEMTVAENRIKENDSIICDRIMF